MGLAFFIEPEVGDHAHGQHRDMGTASRRNWPPPAEEGVLLALRYAMADALEFKPNLKVWSLTPRQFLWVACSLSAPMYIQDLRRYS